jgi:hypothetical protein
MKTYQPGDQLRDEWIRSGNRTIAAGDAPTIDQLLSEKLERVQADASGWRLLYKSRDALQFWELTYPFGEMHGGGPRLLTCLAISDPSEWNAGR